MNNFVCFDYVDNLKYLGCKDEEVRLGYRSSLSMENKHIVLYIKATSMDKERRTSSYRLFIPFKDIESREGYYRVAKEILEGCKCVMEKLKINPNTERKRNMSIYILDTAFEDIEPLFFLLQKTAMGNEINRILNTYYKMNREERNDSDDE